LCFSLLLVSRAVSDAHRLCLSDLSGWKYQPNGCPIRVLSRRHHFIEKRKSSRAILVSGPLFGNSRKGGAQALGEPQVPVVAVARRIARLPRGCLVGQTSGCAVARRPASRWPPGPHPFVQHRDASAHRGHVRCQNYALRIGGNIIFMCSGLTMQKLESVDFHRV
jgi:hypothetical protein